MSGLALAGVYRRHVKASLARIWENVFDWEHLPSLHAQDFAACTLLENGEQGWRVRLVNQPGDEARAQILQLKAERTAHRYRVTTLEGPGASSEIRVALTPRTAHTTDVEVEFHVPVTAPERLAAIGARYVEVYARLWDEDEAMMIARERALRRRRRMKAAARTSVRVGEIAALQLPLVRTVAGAPVRVERMDGELVAFSAVCPHWLGPLDTAPVHEGKVRCPWHGYAFDVRSGAGPHGCALAPAPAVRIEDGVLWLDP
jgi:nitrite reductase/ring-hydroxylating ferredoxin subunit